MKHTFYSLLFLTGACAQAPSGGSIDGVAIPQKVFAPDTREDALTRLRLEGLPSPTEAQIAQEIDSYGMCGRLRQAIQDAARVRAVKELGITVTHAEEAQEHDRAFAQIKQQNPKFNAANLRYNARFTVEGNKLKQEVDRRLALADPQFDAALRHFEAASTRSPDGSQVTTNQNGYRPFFTQQEEQYLAQVRAQFWSREASQLNVQLNDPSLKAKCNLSAIGVR